MQLFAAMALLSDVACVAPYDEETIRTSNSENWRQNLRRWAKANKNMGYDAKGKMRLRNVKVKSLADYGPDQELSFFYEGEWNLPKLEEPDLSGYQSESQSEDAYYRIAQKAASGLSIQGTELGWKQLPSRIRSLLALMRRGSFKNDPNFEGLRRRLDNPRTNPMFVAYIVEGGLGWIRLRVLFRAWPKPEKSQKIAPALPDDSSMLLEGSGRTRG